MSGRKELTVENAEAGLDFLRGWIPESHQGLSWAVLMQDGEDFKVHTRFNQPCYGEMRPYGRDSDRPQDHKPGDLHDPFPKGNPVAIAVPFRIYDYGGQKNSFVKELSDVILNSETSPWKKVLTDFETIYVDDSTKGVILKDTNIDPTAMVQMFMFIRYINQSWFFKRFLTLTEALPDANKNLLLVLACGGTYGVPAYAGAPESFVWNWDYVLDGRFNVKKFNEGDIDILSKDTFYNRSAYNRPELDDVFGKSDTNIQKRFMDAGLQKTKDMDDAKKAYDFLYSLI